MAKGIEITKLDATPRTLMEAGSGTGKMRVFMDTIAAATGDIDDNDIAVVILVEADDPGEDLPGVRDYALRMGSENVADFMWFTNDLPRADPCEDIQIGQ